jgi:hypothetical protein
MDLIEFEWSVCGDGYVLDANGISAKSRRKERWRQYRPLLKIDALFTIFAMDSPSSGKGMLDFANKYGLPGTGGPGGRGGPVDSQALDSLLAVHHQMHRAHLLFERGDPSGLIEACASQGQVLMMAHVQLHRDPAGALHTVLRPPDLVRAMWLQFALHACSGASLQRCANCNKPFTVGGGTKRRQTRMFCDNACKQSAHRAKAS